MKQWRRVLGRMHRRNSRVEDIVQFTEHRILLRYGRVQDKDALDSTELNAPDGIGALMHCIHDVKGCFGMLEGRGREVRGLAM